jgi:hypothetical protein
VWHFSAVETVSNGSIFTISSQFRLFLQLAAVALAASAEGASMAGRAPKARACSINKILAKRSEDGSKRPERSEGRLRSPVGANAMQRLLA